MNELLIFGERTAAMNVFDLAILVILIVAFTRGVMKGFFIEIASLIALIGGIYGAIHFSYLTTTILEDYVSWHENTIALTAFAITFIAILIVVSFLGKLLTKMANFVSLGLINKMLGGLFALLKGSVILSVFFVFFARINALIPLVASETLETSLLYEPIKKIVPTIFPTIVEEIEKKGMNLKRIKQDPITTIFY